MSTEHQLIRIHTFEQVIIALGGTTAVAKLTGRSKSAVCNWRRERQMFPTWFYFLMRNALAQRGFEAPRRLWGFVEAANDNDEHDVAAVA